MQLLTSTYKTNTPCLGRHTNRPTTGTVTFCGRINKNYPSGRLEGCALEKKKGSCMSREPSVIPFPLPTLS